MRLVFLRCVGPVMRCKQPRSLSHSLAHSRVLLRSSSCARPGCSARGPRDARRRSALPCVLWLKAAVEAPAPATVRTHNAHGGGDGRGRHILASASEGGCRARAERRSFTHPQILFISLPPVSLPICPLRARGRPSEGVRWLARADLVRNWRRERVSSRPFQEAHHHTQPQLLHLPKEALLATSRRERCRWWRVVVVTSCSAPLPCTHERALLETPSPAPAWDR